jgi:hypothetical protein
MHPMLLHIVVRTKMCEFENEYCLFAPRYFHFAASVLCPPSCVAFNTRPCSIIEQLREVDLVRLKHFAIKCDFNDILK